MEEANRGRFLRRWEQIGGPKVDGGLKNQIHGPMWPNWGIVLS